MLRALWLVVVHDLIGWFSNRMGRSVDDSARKYKDLAWPMGEPQIGRLLSMPFSVVICLRADVSYFLCCTRATKEIEDVCTQATSSTDVAVLLLNQPIKVQTHGWRHGKLLFFGLSNNGWAMAHGFENFARLYRIKKVKAVHIMLLPSHKPSSSYSLLKFVYVASQLRHSKRCTLSKEKSWIHPWGSYLTQRVGPYLWLRWKRTKTLGRTCRFVCNTK